MSYFKILTNNSSNTATALLMISIDRLIAVKWPLRYISLNLEYSYFIALGLAVYIVMAFGLFVYNAYTQEYVVSCLS